MDWVGHFIARLTLIVPFFFIGFAVEALLGVECTRRAYARNIAVNCLCTVLFFASDVLVSAAWNYYLTDAVRSLPGAGAIALPQPTHLSATYVITMTVIWLAITDFGNYWFHRLQHTSTWLWAEHEVHHSEEQVNVTSAYRHHWLEVPLKAIFISAPMTYLFVPPTGIAAVTYLTGVGLTCFAHWNARVGFGPLNWVLLTPQMHRIHHSKVPAHIDRNFAFIFPLWDVLFSTYYHPRADEYPETGLASGETIVSARQAVAWPFLRWARSGAHRRRRPTGRARLAVTGDSDQRRHVRGASTA